MRKLASTLSLAIAIAGMHVSAALAPPAQNTRQVWRTDGMTDRRTTILIVRGNMSPRRFGKQVESIAFTSTIIDMMDAAASHLSRTNCFQLDEAAGGISWHSIPCDGYVMKTYAEHLRETAERQSKTSASGHRRSAAAGGP